MSEATTTPPAAPAPAAPASAPAPAPAGMLSEPAKPAAPAAPAATESTPAPAAPPAKVEVKWEGVTIPPEVSGKFNTLAGELGLDSAKAQKVADFFVAQQKSAQAAYEKTEAANVEAVKAKYGAELEKSLGLAKRAVDKFGGDALRKAINEAGIGNHPAFVDLFVQLGKSLAEDSVAGGSGSGAAGELPQDQLLRRLYRNSPEMFSKG